MKKNSIIWLVAIVAIAVLFARFTTNAIGDPTGSANMVVKVYDFNSLGNYQLSTKTWSYKTYPDCAADLPAYKEYVGGSKYDNNGKLMNGVFDPTRVGNIREYPVTVYVIGGSVFTTSRPRQDPACVQIIKDFAISAGVNLTQISYVNDTVIKVNNQYVCSDGYVSTTLNGCVGHSKVEVVYSNQTIYLCDGKPVTDVKSCTSAPVAVTENSENTSNTTIYLLVILGLILGYWLAKLNKFI